MGFADRIKAMAAVASQESEAAEFKEGYLMGSYFDPNNLNDILTPEEEKLFGSMRIEDAMWQIRRAPPFDTFANLTIRDARRDVYINPTTTQLGYIAGRGIRDLKKARDPVITSPHNSNPYFLVEGGLRLLDATGQLETNDEVLGQLDRLIEYHKGNGKFLKHLAGILGLYEAKLARNTRQLSFDFMLE